MQKNDLHNDEIPTRISHVIMQNFFLIMEDTILHSRRINQSFLLMSILPIALAASFLASMSWLVVVLGIGVLIFIHELGHFLVAKYEKIRVEKFALGFGPTLFHYKWGETDYCLHLLPLGGYVKLAGENPEEGTHAPDEFMSKTPGARTRVILAGVVMNFILGIVLIIIAFYVGIRFPAGVIGGVRPGSPAWHAGLQQGDEIVAINGQKINEFQKIGMAIAFGDPKQSIAMQYKRGDQLLECLVTPEYNETMGILQIGIAPFFERLQVSEENPLYKAGLRNDDRPIKLGDQEITEGNDLYSILPTLSTQSPVEMVVERSNQQLTFPVQLRTHQVYRLGIIGRQLKIGAIRRNSIAAKIGMKEQEIVTAVNQKAINNYREFVKSLQENPNNVVSMQSADGKDKRDIVLDWKELNITAEKFLDDLYFTPELYIAEVVPETPAARCLQAGDKLTKVNDNKLNRWNEIAGFIAKSEGKSIKITVERGGEEKIYDIEPMAKTECSGEEFVFFTKLNETKSTNIWASCKYGVMDAYQMIGDIFRTLKGLFQRNISAQNLGGPVMIFSASYSQLQRGFGYFLYFLALISINLAVINLFPIPALDGGHLVFLSIEKIQGKPVSPKVMNICSMIGVCLLLFLVVYVTYNDILRLFQ